MKVLILGAGYTGNVLTSRLSKDNEVFLTSRQGSPHVQFELGKEETWDNLPQADYTFWTFPANSCGKVQAFLERKKEILGKIVVIGSTGSYLIKQQNQLIREEDSLDSSSERVKGEEIIRSFGGIVVRASGIYGPNRNPLDWVNSGRVAPSKKLLNLIHVEDLVSVIHQAAQIGKPGSNYIATSNSPIRWDELIEKLQKHFDFKIPVKSSSSEKPSKHIDGSKTLAELGLHLKYPSIIEGVIELNKN